MFFYQELVLPQFTREKKVDIRHTYLPRRWNSWRIKILFAKMMQVFAIQIAPADDKLLLSVDHILGQFLISGVGLLLLLQWSTLFICIIVLPDYHNMLLSNFGFFWHFLRVKDIEQSGIGLQESSDLTPSLSTEQCSSSGVHCSVLKTKISVKNAFFLNYALVLKKSSKIRIGNVKMNIGYN